MSVPQFLHGSPKLLSSPSISPQKDALSAFTHQIRLVRGHFGHYEPIDFLVLLIGYAISGERTLADFFERLSPFRAAFMALFGRANLPHRSSLSRFLADVDRPCARSLSSAFRAVQLCEMHGPRKLLVASLIAKDAGTLSLMWMRHAKQHDNAHYPAIRYFLLHAAASMLSVQRVTRGGSGVRWYAHGPQRGPLHTRQWIGTYGNRGNGDYQAELASALGAIKTYLAHFSLPPQTALVRLDGQYGDAVVIAQLLEAGVYLITRGRTYRMLERPELQRVLTRALPDVRGHVWSQSQHGLHQSHPHGSGLDPQEKDDPSK